MIINGERLKQAREIRGLTQEQLASRVGASQPHISLVEQNAAQISEPLLEAVSLATSFPTTFFLRPSGPDFPLGSLLYRKSKTLSAPGASQIRQTGRASLELVVYLSQRFKSLPIALPRANCEPAQAAQLVRSSLGVAPDSPLTSLMRKLEKLGVLVLFLPTGIDGFSAFSAWSDEDVRRPVIFLQPSDAGDRIRRTLAHELAHLVLHQDFLGSIKELDHEANEFAAELLFPAESMRMELQQPLTLTHLADLKRRWGVSMQAIAYDANERNIISDRQKNYVRARIAKRGWLEKEPVQIPVEYPRLLIQMIESSFASEGEAVRRLAKDTGFSTAFLGEVLRVNKPADTQMAPAGPRSEASILSFPSARGNQA